LQPLSRNATQPEMLDRIDVLHQRMVTMPEIEQAKGAMMIIYGITADAAFALLKWHSQHRNVKLRAIAAALVQATQRIVVGSETKGRLDQLLDDITTRLQRGPLRRRG
jgi:hypothetical protein